MPRRILHADGAAAHPHRIPPAFPRAPRRAGAVYRRLPRARRIFRGDAAPVRRPAAARPGWRGRARAEPRSASRGLRIRSRAARTDPGRFAERPDRPGAEPASGQQPHRRRRAGRCFRCHPEPRPCAARRRNGGPGGGNRGRGLAGGRRRQPLDQGRGRGQSASTRSASWAAGIAVSSKCTWPRAGAWAAPAGRCFRTSSPPAT